MLLATGCAILLSACGGGGGSGSTSGGSGTGTSGPPTVSASGFTPIAAVSAIQAASNAYGAGDQLSQSSVTTAGVLLTGVSVNPAGPGTAATVLGLAKRAYAAGAPSLLTGVVKSESCPGGGTITVDSVVRDATAFSNGDTITIRADKCGPDNADRLDGAVTIVISGVGGNILNSTGGSVTLDTTFNAFATDSGVGTARTTLDGALKIVMTISSVNQTIAVSSSSLKQRLDWSSGASLGRTLSGFSGTTTISSNSATTAASFNVTGYSSALGAYRYQVKNLQPFFYPAAATGTATSGAMLVTGDASSVTLTALDAVNVKVDYSAKGDGAITQSKTMSWPMFLSTF